MKITGQILKENREKKGISLSEVAIATKINVKTLQAMEEGDVGALPPKTFLRGFVRAYAGYLDLDVESVSNNFFEEMGSTKPKASPTAPGSSAQNSAPQGAAAVNAAASGGENASRPKAPTEAHEAIHPRASMAVKIGAVAGILLLLVLIVTIKNKMENYQKETVVEGVPAGLSEVNKDSVPQPPSDAVALGASPAASPIAEASPSPTPSASPSPSPTATPTPTPSPSASPTPQPVVAAAPAPSATPTATPTPKPTATPTPSPSPAPSASPTPASSPSPTPTPKPIGRAQEIIIEALDAVDVEAQIDDEPLKKFRLKGDGVQSIKAKRKVVLRFSDGGAVNLIVNGNERGVPGDLGKPLRIEMP